MDHIIKYLTLPAKAHCTLDSLSIWPDNDLICLGRDNHTVIPFAVLSCKTSLRERFQQTAFWSLAIRTSITIFSAFVTLDQDNELGICDSNPANRRKSRQIAEAYLDRVFVVRNEGDPVFCKAVRPFNEVYQTLRFWRNSIIPHAIKDYLTFDILIEMFKD